MSEDGDEAVGSDGAAAAAAEDKEAEGCGEAAGGGE